MLLTAASAKATGNPPYVFVEQGTFNAGDKSTIENKQERKALCDAKHGVESFIEQQKLFKTNVDYKKHRTMNGIQKYPKSETL